MYYIHIKLIVLIITYSLLNFINFFPKRQKPSPNSLSLIFQNTTILKKFLPHKLFLPLKSVDPQYLKNPPTSTETLKPSFFPIFLTILTKK